MEKIGLLDKPVPMYWREAGSNLEFLPRSIGRKIFNGGRPNRFPRYAQCHVNSNSEKPISLRDIDLMMTGNRPLVDPLPWIAAIILMLPTSRTYDTHFFSDAMLKLYDGRMLAQNGWFVLRSVLPKGKTGRVMTWKVEPHAIPGWIREPNIGFSQVGYLPEQPKVAVIELDRNDTMCPEASLFRVQEDGSVTQVYTAPVKRWGTYFKYDYAKFDFSAVTERGIYYIAYGQTRTENFLIDAASTIR